MIRGVVVYLSSQVCFVWRKGCRFQTPCMRTSNDCVNFHLPRVFIVFQFISFTLCPKLITGVILAILAVQQTVTLQAAMHYIL